MQRNKKIPIISDFTSQGLLIIGLITLGAVILIIMAILVFILVIR